MRLLLGLLLMFAWCGPSAWAQQQDKDAAPNFDQVKQDTKQLEKDWDKARSEYAHRFKEQKSVLDKQVDHLKNELDNGSKDRRARINKELEEAEHYRDELDKLLHELVAVTLVSWTNLKGHKDMKDQ